MNVAIIVLYLIAMVAIGLIAARRARSAEDYRVAGRRLGPVFYTGTMAAVVLGGASTVGGIALGHTYGLSGMWLVVAIAVGVLALSLFFAGRIASLKIYTVSEMLALRFGPGIASRVSSIVILAYTVMLAVTSTSAYASIFTVLFPMGRTSAILLGSLVVIAYSCLGGMWSITLTDMMQFLFMTVGIFAILLPFSLSAAGGWSALGERLGATYFSLDGMGFQSIITMFVVYGFGMLIGQDIWQRVLTARSPQVARWGGVLSTVYIGIFGVAGAVIGMAAAVLMPGLEVSDDAFARMAVEHVPAGLGGIVLSAGVAAMMSTASGALIAAVTVARVDVLPMLKGAVSGADGGAEEVSGDRRYMIVLGVAVTIFSVLVPDVVTALTIAYDLLVGGLLVAILGGLTWRRGNAVGAASSMVAGAIAVVIGMIAFGVMANAPIYIGLAVSAVVFVAVSLATRPTDPDVLRVWDERLAARESTAPEERTSAA
ncbi:sodium:solute symporter [Kocuria palustris]|jgi:SSS family solute:Na+ symporter|uniref:sodium:solute symporter n=1 Tax=Kocuria palustris TaxID=71999 RepID=UPI0019D24BC5|nr:sodium:solute symporter [Kocuria palustris]MBN6753352.1 sodium:solute symporter [Kocuria palustris]MBN6758133.1 sodium:solute symporter [Kocuria palustris]MBN6763161.1 sodium:solute symporter [Kocuria palustris]MBN6782857.1 sodium:solute symporter [Kocuria palustris]MBN6798994.1 sodium:solute symporter [Kocuria palustris]